MNVWVLDLDIFQHGERVIANDVNETTLVQIIKKDADNYKALVYSDVDKVPYWTDNIKKLVDKDPVIRECPRTDKVCGTLENIMPTAEGWQHCYKVAIRWADTLEREIGEWNKHCTKLEMNLEAYRFTNDKLKKEIKEYERSQNEDNTRDA